MDQSGRSRRKRGSISAEEIVAALQDVPEASRPLVQVKDALRGYLAVRFPC